MSKAAEHWADVKERGVAWGPVALAFIYRLLGRQLCLFCVLPTVFYFYLTGAKQRRASLDYLRRVWATSGREGKPGQWQVFQHFYAFAESLVDRFGAWIGQIGRTEIDAIDSAAFERLRDDPTGALVISAHFGALEIARALGTHSKRRPIRIVMHNAQAAQYNDAIRRFAPESQISIIPASDFSVGSAVEISAAVERGEWVVMMGDRLPVRRGAPTIVANFLGTPAHFPQGPFVLAAALRCPIYMLFCYRGAKGYKVAVAPLSSGITAPRRRRMEALSEVVQRYAAILEQLVLEAPYQWFNFYDYWAPQGDRALAGGSED